MARLRVVSVEPEPEHGRAVLPFPTHATKNLICHSHRDDSTSAARVQGSLQGVQNAKHTACSSSWSPADMPTSDRWVARVLSGRVISPGPSDWTVGTRNGSQLSVPSAVGESYSLCLCSGRETCSGLWETDWSLRNPWLSVGGSKGSGYVRKKPGQRLTEEGRAAAGEWRRPVWRWACKPALKLLPPTALPPQARGPPQPAPLLSRQLLMALADQAGVLG